ncbi:hypothetical protein C5167_023422, partial [Papaver somniferum]
VETAVVTRAGGRLELGRIGALLTKLCNMVEIAEEMPTRPPVNRRATLFGDLSTYSNSIIVDDDCRRRSYEELLMMILLYEEQDWQYH